MRRLLLTVIVLALALCGGARAADPSLSCVRDFIAGTPYASPEETDDSLLSAASLLRGRLGLSLIVPEITITTVAQFCAAVGGKDAELLRQVARLRVMPVDPQGLGDIDDGIGPMPFNFSRFKITGRYDGVTCRYIIAGPLRRAEGFFTVEAGRLRFSQNQWWIGGGARLDTFDRFNLALTDDGHLVGKMPVYLNVVQLGEVAQDTHTVTLDGKQEKLGSDMPLGVVKMPVDVNTNAKFHVVSCARGDTAAVPKAYTSDFSSIKVDTKLDNVQCDVELYHVEQEITPPVGTAVLEFHKGIGKFVKGNWSTGGDEADFQNAIFAMSPDRKLLGLLDVWWLFQEKKATRPPALIALSGSEGKLDKTTLAGLLTFPDDNNDSKGTLRIVRCHDVGSKEPYGGVEPPSEFGYDFRKEKLTERYDGASCAFEIWVKEEGRNESVAGGTATFSGSQLILKGYWRVGGLARPNTFEKVNLRVTERGGLVGKMPMFPWVANGVDFKPYPPLAVTIKPTAKGTLGDSRPEGEIVFPVTQWLQGSIRISLCKVK